MLTAWRRSWGKRIQAKTGIPFYLPNHRFPTCLITNFMLDRLVGFSILFLLRLSLASF